MTKEEKLNEIKNRCESLLSAAGMDIPYGERLEVSHHYGIEKFYEFGTSMITILNRYYCKKYGTFWGCTVAAGQGVKEAIKIA